MKLDIAFDKLMTSINGDIQTLESSLVTVLHLEPGSRPKEIPVEHFKVVWMIYRLEYCLSMYLN